MLAIGKKHKVERLAEQASVMLSKQAFANPGQLLDDLVKVVSRSSMISMFEKPKFRDFVNGLGRDDRAALLNGFKKLLHGNQEKGFNEVLNILSDAKLAKWSLITVCLFYLDSQKEVFVKPTTTKKVIQRFEIVELVYKPRPSWEFYELYRETIRHMKSKLDPSLSPNNAAFTGFLMMSM